MDDVQCRGRKKKTQNKHHYWWKSGIKRCCKPGFQRRIKQIIASCSSYWSSYFVCKSKDRCWPQSHFDVRSSRHYISRGPPVAGGCLGIRGLFLQNAESTSEKLTCTSQLNLLLRGVMASLENGHGVTNQSPCFHYKCTVFLQNADFVGVSLTCTQTLLPIEGPRRNWSNSKKKKKTNT